MRTALRPPIILNFHSHANAISLDIHCLNTLRYNNKYFYFKNSCSIVFLKDMNMATNAQLEQADRIAAAHIKFSLIRQGLLESDGYKSSFNLRVRAAPMDETAANGRRKQEEVLFNIPITRMHRFTDKNGMTSYHLSHKSITRVTYETYQEGTRVSPGAAKSHCSYIERDAAVARLDPVEKLADEIDVKLSRPDGVSQSDEVTRLSNSSDLPIGKAADGQFGSMTIDQDIYITRDSAVSRQPDGQRALITNIDNDDRARAEYWALVEEHEAKPSPDKMSFRFADNPEFWSTVSKDQKCPLSLKKALAATDADCVTKFDIESIEQMRDYLSSQPGCILPAKGKKSKSTAAPVAKFHKGRGGRIQFRLTGELPNELSAPQMFALLKDITEEFSKRKLPFVAVMHAPDHKNNDRNWHFHLIYHDRPCRRITQGDIATLEQQGYGTDRLKAGQWDFTAVTTKQHRSNGRAVPLKQKKVREVAEKRWIETLREISSEITNRHLEQAGHKRRVDHRSNERRGIEAEPPEHLGSALAAAEARGEVTDRGVENERRQWEAIMAQADAKLEDRLSDIGQRTSNADRENSSAGKNPALDQEIIAAMTQAARLEHEAFVLDQNMQRARSRAATLKKKNEQLLAAYRQDSKSVSRSQYQEAKRLVDAASAYLLALKGFLEDESQLLTDCRNAADEAGKKAEFLISVPRQDSVRSMPDSSVTLHHPQSEKSTNAPVQRDRTETSKANISALILDGIEPIDKNSAQHRGDGDPVANEPRQVSEADNEGQKKLDDARDERLRRKVEQNALLQRKADEEYALQSARLTRGIDEMIASDNRKEGDDHVSENQAKDAAPLPIPANAPTTPVPAQYEHHPHARELRGAFKPDQDPTEFDQRDLKLRQHRRQISSFLDDLAPSITDLKKDEAGIIWPYNRRATDVSDVNFALADEDQRKELAERYAKQEDEITRLHKELFETFDKDRYAKGVKAMVEILPANIQKMAIDRLSRELGQKLLQRVRQEVLEEAERKLAQWRNAKRGSLDKKKLAQEALKITWRTGLSIKDIEHQRMIADAYPKGGIPPAGNGRDGLSIG